MLYPIILRIRHLWDFEKRRLFSNVFFSSENFNPLIWIWCNEREKTNLLLFWRKKRKVSFSVILFKPLRCFNIEKSWNNFSSSSMFNVKFFSFPKNYFQEHLLEYLVDVLLFKTSTMKKGVSYLAGVRLWSSKQFV